MAIRRVALGAAAVLLLALALSSTVASAEQSSGSNVVATEAGQMSGRELLAALAKKPLKKKPTKVARQTGSSPCTSTANPY